MKAFLNGMEKKDERILFAEMKDKVATMLPGDRLIRRNTQDRCLLFIIRGSFFGLGETFPATKIIYNAGAILGCEQFLNDDRWELDIICKDENSVIAKLDYDSYCNMRESSPASAIKLYNRVVRNLTYKMIYDKKNNAEYYSKRM